MNQQTLADKMTLWMLCGAVAVIVANVGWLRELLLIWLAIGAVFAFFPLFGSIVGPRLEKLWRLEKVWRRDALLSLAPAPVRYQGPFPQRSFHRKDYSVN